MSTLLPSLGDEPPHPQRSARLVSDPTDPASRRSPIFGHDVAAALLGVEHTSLYFEIVAEPPQPGEDPWAEADAAMAWQVRS